MGDVGGGKLLNNTKALNRNAFEELDLYERKQNDTKPKLKKFNPPLDGKNGEKNENKGNEPHLSDVRFQTFFESKDL